MGASGSGKTSMRSLILSVRSLTSEASILTSIYSSNNPASLTSRLGATIDVEQNHVRFLGDLILNLWDCGGQDAFMDSYLSTQQSTIFQHVGVLIYVFEVESRSNTRDLDYYTECLNALRKYSPEAAVFLLIHKMDLVRPPKEAVLEKKTAELRQASGETQITVFGTSIYDESLYKVCPDRCLWIVKFPHSHIQAWSRIVHTLIPNASVLTRHLTKLANACNATEVVLFERTTFLVIATSSPPTAPPAVRPPSPPPPSTPSTQASFRTQTSRASALETDDGDPHKLAPTRYERTSELIKAFKHSCARVREEFHTLEMELPDFTAVLDELTKNTYVLIVVHDPTIGECALHLHIKFCSILKNAHNHRAETAALRMNVRLARKKFEELQQDSLTT